MKYAFFTFLLLYAVAPRVASAGEKIGNGGGAWACVASNGSVKWLRQIDLYEGTTEYHLPIQERSTDFYAQAEAAVLKLSRVDERLGRDYAFALMNVKMKARFVRAELELINDALYRIRPYSTECAGGEIRYLQMANFKDSDHDHELIIREDLWNHPDFSETERAALYLHEAIYAELRAKFDEPNSTRARHVTALLLSDLDGEELKREVKAVLEATPSPTRAIPMTFVKIPAGTYIVGKPGEERTVRLDEPFEIMATEVTEAHFHAVFQRPNGSGTRREKCPSSFIVMRTEPYETGYCPNLPVLFYGTGDSVDQFTNRMTELSREGYYYRLPTGDEWEIAARAGSTRLYFFGDENSPIEDYAVVSSERLRRTQPMDVATKKPNAFGLFDTVGNYAELATYVSNFGKRIEIRSCGFETRPELYNGISECSESRVRRPTDSYSVIQGAVRLIREKR